MARITISEDELEHLVSQSVADFGWLLDVKYEVDVQLGSSRMSIGDLLELQPGKTVSLDSPATDYVSVVIGKTRVAAAEVLTRKKGTAARIIRLA